SGAGVSLSSPTETVAAVSSPAHCAARGDRPQFTTFYGRGTSIYGFHEAPFQQGKGQGTQQTEAGQGETKSQVPVLHERGLPASRVRRLQGPADAQGDDHPRRPHAGPPPHRQLRE